MHCGEPLPRGNVKLIIHILDCILLNVIERFVFSCIENRTTKGDLKAVNKLSNNERQCNLIYIP